MNQCESERGQPAAKEPRRITWRQVELEDDIARVFDAPSEPGERIEITFRRQEHDLLLLFDRLSVLDAMELYRRFTLVLAEDPLAMRFTRLIAERRVRLLSFLADARRREAMRRAR